MTGKSLPFRGVKRVFSGQFLHSADAKGRISVPARFREILEKQYSRTLMITTWDGCLWAFPAVEWERLEQEIAKQPAFDHEIKKFRRTFMAPAQECPVDDAGRVAVPAQQRAYAKIEREVVILGMGARIEIWSKPSWEKDVAITPDEEANINRRLAEIGIK